MNLLFLNSYPTWGGGETWMLDVAAGMRARGHRCVLIGRPGTAWFERTRELGWGPVGLELRRVVMPGVALRLRRLYRQVDCDLALCNFDQETRLAALARGFDRSPVIVNMKGLPLLDDNARYRFTYRHLIDHTVVCAAFIRERFLQHPWIDPAKLSVIPNCYQPPESGQRNPGENRPPRSAWSLPPDAPLVGAAARFDPRKGLLDLVRAAPKIVASVPNAHFVLIGEGAQAEALRGTAQVLGLAARFRFPGFARELDRWMEELAVFVLSSHDEGLPYVLQIAMHHGRPIVATAVGGVPDTVGHEREGLLVPPGDPEAIASAVLRLLNDPPLGRRLGEQARRAFRDRFNHERMCDEFEHLFLRLLKGDRPASSGHPEQAPARWPSGTTRAGPPPRR